MYDEQMADRARLEMRWLPVTDDHGDTRMQSVWVQAGATSSAPAMPRVHHAA